MGAARVLQSHKTVMMGQARPAVTLLCALGCFGDSSSRKVHRVAAAREGRGGPGHKGSMLIRTTGTPTGRLSVSVTMATVRVVVETNRTLGTRWRMATVDATAAMQVMTALAVPSQDDQLKAMTAAAALPVSALRLVALTAAVAATAQGCLHRHLCEARMLTGALTLRCCAPFPRALAGSGEARRRSCGSDAQPVREEPRPVSQAGRHQVQ